jgi:hypothetical protein
MMNRYSKTEQDCEHNHGFPHIPCHLEQEGREPINRTRMAGNPIQFLEMNWDNVQMWPEIAKEYRDDIARVRDEKREEWFELMLTRIRDTADLKLLRNDNVKW